MNLDDLESRVESQSPDRRKLMARLNARTAGKVRRYPLAFAQQGIWFIHQLDPESPLYNMPVANRYRGPLDEQVLWRAIREVVQRHESLRTIFPARNGVAVQEVLPDVESLERTIDLSLLPAKERVESCKRLLNEWAREPFDLVRGPLLRVILVKLAEQDHVLFIVLHHIVGDGWSMSVLQRELDALYEAYARGEQDSPLPPLQLQYGDYAIWQRGWLSSGAMERQMGFWKAQLADVADAVLPTDYPRPSMLAHRGREIGREYSVELSDALTRFCRRANATPFMVFLAIFEVAVARYLGVTDFTVGAPIANRNRVATEGVIGCFMNTLVLRSDVVHGLSFRQLVARVRERTLSAYENQELPFERLVEELVPIQSLGRTPLFQAMFAFENFPSTSSLQQLDQSDVSVNIDLAKVELIMTVSLRDRAYLAKLEYDTDLFAHSRMQHMLEHFGLLLEAMVADPDCDIWRSSLLPEDERRSLLGWSRGRREVEGALVCEHIEANALARPDALAVVTQTANASYGMLNTQANQLARHLAGLGVGSEVPVGVLMERGIDLYASLLGIIKAGGVYVPLDPAYPDERLAFMASDAQVQVLLVHEQTRERAPAGPWTVLDMDAQRETLQAHSMANLSRTAAAENLAYVMYTSGSTGQPKGVGISHRALMNQLAWASRDFALGPADRFLQKASISFDSSIEEILAPLVSGACVVAARPRGEYDVEYLADLVAREGVTCIDLSPSLLEALMEVAEPNCWQRVRLVISGGEVLRPELRDAFGGRFVGTLLNTYGPTETTVQAAWCSQLQGSPTVPIGRPVDNTQLYVLDEWMELVPAGTRGELYIGGSGLARGYVNRSGLTAERFVPSPIAGTGERLYRSGDQVRWREDGLLEYLGRVDRQVKLRGYRIELSEIERVLEGHPQVQQAVALVREDQPGLQQLVAYILADRAVGGEIRADALRSYMVQTLPEHMAPAAFVVLDAFPLSANGKLDRGALPAPVQASFAVRAYEAPRGSTERRITDILAEVLKVERIGRHDNFFELGGHSLLAVQVISRIQKAFEREFRLADLFIHPSAHQIAVALLSASPMSPPPIRRCTATGYVPLSFAQQRLWFLDHIEGAGQAYNLPLGLRLQGPLDVPALRQALQQIGIRHEALRTTFGLVNNTPVQRIVSAENFRFELVEEDIGAADGATLQQRIECEKAAAFDLMQGPLIRGRLIHLGPHDHVLLVTMHHVSTDGWSVGVFWDECWILYRAFQSGQPDPLAPLSLQYADYAVWQREWLTGAFLRQQTDFWKTTLAGAPQLLQLPTERPRQARQNFAGDFVGFALNAEMTQALRKLSHVHGTTLYMILLSGWAALLSRLSGQQDVVIGTPTMNRPRPELEELIGFFVNMLPLRIDLGGAMTVGELLQRVKATFLAAHEHEHLPFEQIVELCGHSGQLAHNPIFQAMFVWQGAGRAAAPAPCELRIEDVEMGASRTAKVDVTLTLEEQGQRICGGIEYATALFERATIERWVGHLRRLLESMVKEPGLPISALPWLSDAEQRHLLELFNVNAHVYPTDRCLHEAFAERVRCTPEATALVYEDRELSYGELNVRANQLSHRLIRLGIGPEWIVGLCVERSIDMVVGLLGILKAGAAYLPLDSHYPPERLAYMLGDARVTHVIVHAPTRERLPGALTAQRIDLEADAASLAEEPAHDPPPRACPENLAYVIYTSGSTGQPKGALLTHGNVLRLFAATDRQFGFGPRDVWTLFHSFAFDFSVWEVFGALLYGGKLVVVPYLVTRSPDAFLELLRQQHVTVLNQTPSAFRQLIAVEDASRSKHGLEALRLVVFGGEALQVATLEPWLRLHGSAQPMLVNMYGITETTVHVTYCPLTDIATGRTASPIGQAIADLRVYLLDGHLNPVPSGVPGELYVSGPGLARGYLNRGRLTAERFLPDPWSPRPGQRMYKTGDVARYGESGQIEFLGRADEQLKVRGYRIEPGEIEATLLEHPEVRQAIVMARTGPAGDKRLTGYVVAKEPALLEARVLRDHLRQRLPEYMVPAALVVLDRLPLTANGKVDPAALPTPEGRPEVGEYIAPQNVVQEILARIWAEVLGVDDVGIEDNFFGLGGDSIRTLQVVESANHRQLAVTVADIFEHQTIAALAKAISGRDPTHGSPPQAPLHLLGTAKRLPQLLEGKLADAYPLATMQRIMVIEHERNPRPALGIYHVQQSFRVQDARPSFTAMRRAIELLTQAHPVLRTTIFTTPEGELLQGLRSSARVEIAQQDLVGMPEEEQDRHVAAELEKDRALRFVLDDPDRALFRSQWLRLAEDRFELLLSIHHAIDDGWGNQHFLGQLFQSYQIIRDGGLPDIRIGENVYKEFVALEHEMRESRQAQDFWQQMDLSITNSAVLNMRPPDTSAVEEQCTLDAGLVRALRALSRRLDLSLKAVFLSACMELVASVAGVQRPTIGVVTNGRSHRLSDPLHSLGLFWNLVPVCLPAVFDEASATMRGVQRRLLEIEPYAIYPLTQIAESRGVSELFFATFNFVNFHNSVGVEPKRGLSVLRTVAHDRFHYPLNFTVMLESRDGSASLHVGYDSKYFTDTEIKSMNMRFMTLLDQYVAGRA